jgi:outer membrane protein assembly factor BamD (BamD/ComL family)
MLVTILAAIGLFTVMYLIECSRENMKQKDQEKREHEIYLQGQRDALRQKERVET